MGVNASSAATERTGVVPIASRSSAGGVQRRLRLRREDDEVCSTGSIRVGRALHGELGGRGTRAFRIARADHDLVSRLGEAPGERGAEASRPTYEGDLHETASSTASASRRAAALSVISVRVAINGTSPSAGMSAVSTTSASISPS